MLRHLRNPRLVATYVVGFNVLFSLVAVFTYITFHLAAAPYLLTPAQLSSLFVVYLVGLIVTPLAGIGIGRAGSRPVLIVAVIASMIGVSMTLLHSLPLILLGLVLCSSGVFVCQSASTSYIQTAARCGRAVIGGRPLRGLLLRRRKRERRVAGILLAFRRMDGLRGRSCWPCRRSRSPWPRFGWRE